MIQLCKRKSFFRTSLTMGLFLFIVILGSKSIQAGELSFNKSKTITISDQDSYAAKKQFVWVKYKAPADGYIRLKANYGSNQKNYSSGEWTFYNKSKAIPLSEKNIVYNTKKSDNSHWQTSTFGVKKKTTYYIRVKAFNSVKITCSFQKVNEKSGTRRQTAVNLKKGKTIKGLVFADGNTPDWYKMKLTGKKKLYLYFKVGSEGKYRISLYSGLGKGLRYSNLEYSSKEQKITICQKNRRTGKISGIDAGTYYLKIEPVKTSSSGYYTLKWK